ncbi:MAG: 30S ribosomal protein S17 [Chloroflexota bacterium]|nr:30S ribosomal protein S17 [Chloroflexota bacterium]PLS80053.1 MAG: 30S ribosomal protein S17 [Chloroflexota bacterium]
MAEAQTSERAVIRREKVGRVVSNKMDKTVVVAVDYLRPHPIYRKTVRQTHKFYAHDETNTCQIGDTVRIEETRPLSKLKRWRVIEVLGSKDQPIAPAVPADIVAPRVAQDNDEDEVQA